MLPGKTLAGKTIEIEFNSLPNPPNDNTQATIADP